MPRIAQFDFTDAPPAQGGGGDDYIPPGEYVAKTISVEDGTSQGGKRMMTLKVEVAAGDYKGSSLTDRFAFGNAGDSKFPLQRWHAFLVAVGVQIKGPGVRLDLDLLENRPIQIQVKDETQLYKGENVTRSRIVAYYGMNKQSPATTAGQAPVAAVAAAPAAAPAAPPAPPPPAPPPAPPTEPIAEIVSDPVPVAAAAVSASAETAEVAEIDISTVDSLFD